MKVAEEMFDAEVRVEAMMWVPGLAACEDSFPDVFEDEFCEGLPQRADDVLYAQLPALARFADGDDYPEASNVAETLRGTPGFLVQAATPTRHYIGDKGVFSSGWGCYHTAWLYAADETQIPVVCVAWAEERHESDRAEKAA